MRDTEAGSIYAPDWSRVVVVGYRIEQTFRYDYSSPIRRLQHKLVISPRAAHGNQRRVSNKLLVSADAPAQASFDAFGNDVVSLHVPHVERSIAFALTSHVVRDSRLGPHVDVSSFGDPRALCVERRLICPDEALRDVAADLRVRHRDPEELAHAIADFVYREMIYTKGVTDVFTTAAAAFSMRRGVCQDYSHVAIALSRRCGLPARYVSGHMIGEGATHAWVEFLVPGRDSAYVVSLDPTNGCATNLRYVVAAIGRDYDDVAPTSGVYVGKSAGAISSRQSVHLTAVTYAA
jgi:transglutaminase-like putative cysteine protease